MKIPIILFFLSLATPFCQAQNEFSVWGGGGLSSLGYSLNKGSHTEGGGGFVGVGYQYYFSPNWGIGTGIEVSLLNAEMESPDLKSEYETVGPSYVGPNPTSSDINHFLFTGNYKSISESQQAVYLNIPVMARYEYGLNTRFYAAAGVKIGIPVRATFEQTAHKLITTGYYPYEGTTYTDLPQHGFTTFEKRTKKGNLDLGVSVALSAEIGVKWKLTDITSFYMGVYCDYGVNNVNKSKKNNPLLEYNHFTPSQPIQHSVTQSYYLSGNQSTPILSSSIRPIAGGLKIQLGFSVGGNRR